MHQASSRLRPAVLEKLEARQLFAVNWNLAQIGVPAAWDAGATGSTNVVVAGIDTGIDYAHPDLYKNVWINQAEIPVARRANLSDIDADGRITFYDLNNVINQGTGKITDLNGNGRIDGGDLLRAYNANGTGGWADGVNGATYSGDTKVDDIIGWDFANNDNNPLDYYGHGTMTAGIIGAANDLGIAKKVQVMAVKIFTDSGGGATAGVIGSAIRYAADAGARISNNSWGYYFGSKRDAIYKAIQYASSKNHLFVAAAGNDAINNDKSAWKSYPASFDLANIVSVASTNQSGGLSWFSNYGKSSVDLGAPGEGIYGLLPTYGSSMGSNYGTYNGTSFASPHVAGVAALLLAKNPTWSTSQIKSRLLSTTDPLTSLSGKTVTGGRVNAANAVGVTTTTTTSLFSSTLVTEEEAGKSGKLLASK